MADSWREQWKRQQQQFEQQQQQQRRRQRQREQQQAEQDFLDEASERLHEFVVEMLSGFGLTEQQLLILLDAELEWYAGDVRFVPLDP